MRARADEATRYERTKVMGQEKISKLLLSFSGPAILAAETSAFYNLFDAIWCGRLSAEALAALSVANPLMAIYRAIAAGIGVGVASLISRNLGAGKKEEANRNAGCSMSLFLIVSSLMTIICLMNLESLLRLFGANDSVLPYAMSYMYVETCSIAVDFFLFVLVELVRVQGNPTLSSASLITASVLDLVWSPLLVFGFGPIPALGIAGAALGTTIGRGIGVSILLIYLGLGKSIYDFKRSYFLPNLRIVIEIYSTGISQTVRASSTSISLTLANRVAASFGVIPLAVLGVLFKVNMLVFSLCIGLSQGMLPLIGYNFGAQKKGRVGEVVVKAGLISFIWGVLCWVVITLFSTQVLSLFYTNPSFLEMGTLALRIFALSFFTIGLQINLSSFFQGIGKGIPSLVVASSRDLIFLIPCLLIMPTLLGITGLWTSYVVANVLSFVLSLIWAGIAFRSLKIPFHVRLASSAL